MAETAAPPTGADLLPPLEDLRHRMMANLREGRILRDLIRVAEKDARIPNPTRQPPRWAQAVPPDRQELTGVAG
jgi:hypothetical protein